MPRSQRDPWFWLAMPIAALWGLAMPAAQGLMTRQVDPREQGRLQGAVVSLSSLAGIIAPTLFTRAFASVSAQNLRGPLAGLTFWLAALLLLLALGLAWRGTAASRASAAARRVAESG